MKKSFTVISRQSKGRCSVIILLSAFVLSAFFSYSQNSAQKDAVAFKLTYAPKNKSQKVKYLERNYGNYLYFYRNDDHYSIVNTYKKDTLRVITGLLKDTVFFVRYENDPYLIKRQMKSFTFEKQQDEFPVFILGERSDTYHDSENNTTIYIQQGQPLTCEMIFCYHDIVRIVKNEKDYTVTMNRIDQFQFTNFSRFFNYDDLMIITNNKECTNLETIHDQIKVLYDCLDEHKKFPNLLINKQLEGAFYLIYVIDTNGRIRYVQLKPAYFRHHNSIDYIYNPRRTKRYTRLMEKRYLKAFNVCTKEKLFDPPKSETGHINIRIHTTQRFSFYSHH
jgi:hypothetical protein